MLGSDILVVDCIGIHSEGMLRGKSLSVGRGAPVGEGCTFILLLHLS